MASKEQKKAKIKLLKQNQKENKKKIQSLIDNFSEELDFNCISELDGIKAYVLLKLSKIIYHLKSGLENDLRILETTKELKCFAKDPEETYYKYIECNKEKISNENLFRIKCLSRYVKYNLNTTERALLKTQMQAIEMEYVSKNLDYESIDYGAIRICFELCYEAIFLGLEEKIIDDLDIYIGYGDTLSDFKVTYEDTDKKYDLNEHIFLKPHWNSLDELYNNYSIYKHKYINFEESSLNSLATAYATQKEYDSRKVGRELLSFNGIALNYFNVLELELKKLILQDFNKNYNKLTLEDAINHLKGSKFGELSSEKLINRMHELRKLRNKVAHGYNITYEECQSIYDSLINEQILEFISWNLIYKNSDNPVYQFELGLKYFNGVKAEKNYQEALHWFTKSAEQGHAEAQNLVACMYEGSLGVERDYKEALKWYTKSSEQGFAESQNSLGYFYKEGRGTEINYKEALKWYKKSAEQGFDNSQSWLASMYMQGIGTEINYKEAVEWATKSAEQGNDASQNYLGYMYTEGLGVKKSIKQALKWYTKSAEQGNIESMNGLAILNKKK